MRKPGYLLTALLLLTVLVACKKKTDPEPEPEPVEAPRDVINYVMTVNPRAENKNFTNLNKDTLIIKVNGNAIITSKGSVAETYQQYQVKTGDVVSIYYYPGKMQYGNDTIYDENALLLSLTFATNNNIKLKEYNCRCRADENVTVP
jgi:hypothetical protein